MKSEPTNVIPVNVWVEHFEHFISPLRPGEFELTPILRARYGNLLRDNIVSVRLFAEGHNLLFIITEVGNTEKVIVDFARTGVERRGNMIGLDELFFRDVPEAPARQADLEERQAWFNRILSSLLWLFDSAETARYIPVFTKHYHAMLERIQLNDNAAQDLLYTENRLENTVTFYKECLETLAAPLHKVTRENLISKLAKRMKKQEATGILSDSLNTYWDEIGVIVNQGSDNVLYETLCNELFSEAYHAIKKLSEAEQFALWFFGEEVDGNLSRWFMDDFEGVTMDNIQKDFSTIARDIRDELLGMAMNSLSPAAMEYLDY
jgi:hypothetical protein